MRIAMVLAVALFGTTCLADVGHAQAATQRYPLNIPRQSLDMALKDLAQQTGLQIGRFGERIDGSAAVGPVTGAQTPAEALKLLLEHTGLAYKIVSGTTFAIYNPLESHQAVDSFTLNRAAGDSRGNLVLASAPVAEEGVPVHGSGADSVSNEDSTAGLQLEEVVVTAEKRSARVQDTPISVTAISAAEIAASGLSGAADLAREIPGVALTSAGPGQSDYTIRGLSSSGASVATVGFYLDDAPMTAPSGSQNGHVAIDPNLYDLNRVEVLRGPQGTLYGSGSMGGTIKLVTNQPDVHTFAASAKVEGSGTQGGGFNRGIDAMLNLPLIEGKLALRIVGTDEHTSGWIDRVVVGDYPLPTNPQPQCAPFYGCTRGNVAAGPVTAIHRDVNDADVKGARAALRYQATDDFSLTATAFYQQISQDGLNYFDNPPGTEAHYQPFDVAEPFGDTFRVYNLVGEYTLPALTITAATSYWTRNQSQTQDISETMQTTFDLPGYTVADGGVGPVSITELDATKQFSEEIRLTSAAPGPFQWLFGGFYSDYQYVQDQFSLAAGFVPLFGSDNLFTARFTNSIKQNAQFGEASYKLTDTLKATVGLRHYSYSQDGTQTVSGIVEPTFTPVTTLVSARNSGLNPKFTLSQAVNSDVLLYGTAAKGFRPGAGNAPLPTSSAISCQDGLRALGLTQAPTQYNPDTVWSYELGEKATLLDRRFTVNSAAYHEVWKNVQQDVALPCGFGFIGNVGTASVWGGESEVSFKLTRDWTISQSGGYTHAVLTSTAAGTGLDPGSRLLRVPTYTANTSLAYSHPFGQFNFVARASTVFVGSSEDLTYFQNRLPGYAITRLRGGLAGDTWSAFLFVDNLTDKQAFLANTTNYALNIPSLNRVATNQPRTIGVTFEVRR